MEEREDMEEVYNENSDIELHPENVRQRQDTYSSLTDLEGINIFYDDFQETISKVKKIENKKLEEINQAVFVDEIIVENGSDVQITSNLFRKQEEMVLKHDYQEGNNKSLALDISLALIAVLAVAALYIFFFNERKIRRK